MTTGESRWPVRTVPPDLVERYVRDGHWTDETLGGLVESGLAAARDEVLRVHSDVHPWEGTLGDVDRAARALAGALQQRGVGPGDVVVFQLPNWVEAGITFWATAYLGAVVVPIVHFYGPKEVGYILEVTRPKVVVTPDGFRGVDHLAMYGDLLEGSEALWLVVPTSDAPRPERATRFDALLDGPPIAAPLPVDPDDVTLIAFTSGTTRNPKGVLHTHRTMAFEARQLNGMMGEGPPAIIGAPVGHFIGMLNAFLVSLAEPRSMHMVDVWDPGVVLRLMLEHGIGMAGGSTYFLLSLLDHPSFTADHLALMPFAGLGGSPVPVAVTERAEAMGIKVYRSYGSTELPSATGSYLDEPAEKRMRTDGHVLPGVELRLDDVGQILLRGPELCLGYTDPELTRAAFDADGWYHTGDIGVLDGEGYLSITDRVSDVIIRGGENISAQEVEEQLLGIDAVAEACVVSAPDDRLGERAAAVVRLRDGAPAPTLAEVRDHLAKVGLAKQKWPELLYVVADLPRTASGKVQKFRLREQVRSGELTPA